MGDLQSDYEGKVRAYGEASDEVERLLEQSDRQAALIRDLVAALEAAKEAISDNDEPSCLRIIETAIKRAKNADGRPLSETQ